MVCQNVDKNKGGVVMKSIKDLDHLMRVAEKDKLDSLEDKLIDFFK